MRKRWLVKKVPAKLGEAEVADITRRAAGERLASIAKSYAVDVSMMSQLR